MSRRLMSVGAYRVSDVVNYDGRRMRVAGFPNHKMMQLVTLVHRVGEPSSCIVAVEDKKVSVISVNDEVATRGE